MYKLLLVLMVGGVFQGLDLSVNDFYECKSKQCLNRISKASNQILKIDWKPISAFPMEANRFR